MKPRRDADFYPTPPDAVRPFIERLIADGKLPPGDKWLEPCAGNGAIVRAVNREISQLQWSAVEIRRECYQALEYSLVKHIYCPLSFLACGAKYDVIITNPPFSIAQEIIDRALRLAPVVMMLLRLDFLGGQKRRQFHIEHPSSVYVLSKRPSFTGDGCNDRYNYGWFCWGPQFDGRIVVL